MSQPIKHVGRIRNTGRRCIVVFMQIPGRDDHALVLDTDALPERWHDAIQNVLTSQEGQHERHFYNILSRRTMPDTGVDMLTTLHQGGLLQPVPASNIVMLPLPNNPIPLPDIITAIQSIEANANKPAAQQQAAQKQYENERYNRIDTNIMAHATEQQEGTARGLLYEAELLMADAAHKREEAYRMAPSLRPAQFTQVQAPAPVVSQAPTLSPQAVLNSLKASSPAPTTDIAAIYAEPAAPAEVAPVAVVADAIAPLDLDAPPPALPADFADPESAALYNQLTKGQ